MSPSPTLPTLSIVTGPLPNGMLTFAYSQNIQASAGVAPIKWRISSGNLPPGLAPGAAPQVLSRFRDANAAQSSTFSVEVTDSKIQTARQLRVKVLRPKSPMASGPCLWNGYSDITVYAEDGITPLGKDSVTVMAGQSYALVLN